MNITKKIRPFIQLGFLLLTGIGLFTAFEITSLIIMILMIGGGVYHCGWICAFGTIQDFFSRLGTNLSIKKKKMPQSIQRYLQYTRYLLFALFMLTSLDFLFTILSFDPRINLDSLIQGKIISIPAIIIVILFSIISIFFDRPFCNYLCIEGAKFGLISSLRIFTIKRNATSCINCKKCDKVCPMNIEVSKTEQMHNPQCINCFECTNACPVESTLTYGLVHKTSRLKNYYVYTATLFIIALSGFLIFTTINSESLESSISVYDNESIASSVKDAATDSTSNSINQKSSHVIGKHITATDNDTTNSEVLVDEAISTITDTEIESLGSISGILDGVYTGSAMGFRGTMTVEVTISDESIIKVEVVNHREDNRWFNRANRVIPSSIIEEQSVDVSVVSGATYSSNGIINAVADALTSVR